MSKLFTLPLHLEVMRVYRCLLVFFYLLSGILSLARICKYVILSNFFWPEQRIKYSGTSCRTTCEQTRNVVCSR